MIATTVTVGTAESIQLPLDDSGTTFINMSATDTVEIALNPDISENVLILPPSSSVYWPPENNNAWAIDVSSGMNTAGMAQVSCLPGVVPYFSASAIVSAIQALTTTGQVQSYQTALTTGLGVRLPPLPFLRGCTFFGYAGNSGKVYIGGLPNTCYISIEPGAYGPGLPIANLQQMCATADVDGDFLMIIGV